MGKGESILKYVLVLWAKEDLCTEESRNLVNFVLIGSGEGGNRIVMKKREVFPVIRKGMFWGGAVVLSLCAYGIFLAAGGTGGRQGEGSLACPEGIIVQGLAHRAVGAAANVESSLANGEGFQAIEKGQEPGTAEERQRPDIAAIQQMPAGTVLDHSTLPAEMADRLFCSMELPEDVRQRIWGVSYHENENISLEELRYLRVLHIGFDGLPHIGELIVNQRVAEDVLEVMAELYRQSYPIEKMLLIDEYGAEDSLSMADNNTSAFNYREIAGSGRLSKHAKGLAIDINPLYNPYVKQTGEGEAAVSPPEGAAYADRAQEFPYKIEEGDLCCQLFGAHGFIWGGSWNSVKDYQHFEYAE